MEIGDLVYVGRTKRCGMLRSEPFPGLVLISYLATEPLPVLVFGGAASWADDGAVSLFEERRDIERAEGPPDPPAAKPALVFSKIAESGAFTRRIEWIAPVEEPDEPDCSICLGYGTDFDARGNARPCPGCR